MERPSTEQRYSSELPSYNAIQRSHTAQTAKSQAVPATPLERTSLSSQTNHQRFVLADPVAFSYLEEARHTVVLERTRFLQGYQVYIVEQWACSRSHPTFAIIAYTGDSTHYIKVGVLSVPADEESWSPRMRVYFKSLAQYHAQRKETPLGALMVTNLSTFPSSLTIVHVPGGDLRKHGEDFFVAENLKRLGCSGRVGLSLAEPTSATLAKFYQLYKVSDKINLFAAVIELVKLCQVALMLFDCLGPEYADGLLCDITEQAMRTWWARIGTDLYNIEPKDGILGPTSVAALLGTLIGARNRLNAVGAPVPKDVFDVETTKRAIAAFQRMQRLQRSRRFDNHTLNRLHKVTAKQAAGEGWGVPRAVKSTVAELSGRGGEMVMDIVGRSDKANITEIETVDIEAFAHLVKGERAQWLWQGKPRKRTTRDMFNETPDDDNVFAPPTPLQQDSPLRTLRPNLSRSNTQDDTKAPPPYQATPLEPIRSSGDWSRQDNQHLPKHGAFKKAKGRLKGVVGLRNQSIDEIRDVNVNGHSAESFHSDPGSPSSFRKSAELPQDHESGPGAPPKFSTVMTSTPVDSTEDLAKSTELAGRHSELLAPGPSIVQDNLYREPTAYDSDVDPLAVINTSATANAPSTTQTEDIDIKYKGRPRSLPDRNIEDGVGHNENWWPRQLSFSTAATAILTTPNTAPSQAPTTTSSNLSTALKAELLRADTAHALNADIATIQSTTATWVSTKINQVEDLSLLASQDAEQLNSMYYPRKHEFQTLQQQSQEILAEERTRLHEGVRDIDTVRQKLEYELDALRGKVEDAESAVDEFEKQVLYAEARVNELLRSSDTKGWFAWLGRSHLFSSPRSASKSPPESQQSSSS